MVAADLLAVLVSKDGLAKKPVMGGVLVFEPAREAFRDIEAGGQLQNVWRDPGSETLHPHQLEIEAEGFPLLNESDRIRGKQRDDAGLSVSVNLGKVRYQVTRAERHCDLAQDLGSVALQSVAPDSGMRLPPGVIGIEDRPFRPEL